MLLCLLLLIPAAMMVTWPLMMRTVVSVRLQHLHQASAVGVVLPESEVVRPRLLVLLRPKVLVQVKALLPILNLPTVLLKQRTLSGRLLQWLNCLHGLRTPVLTTMGLFNLLPHLHQLFWLLALLVDEGTSVGSVGTGFLQLVSW